MNLIHIEIKLVYTIYILLFYISIAVWLISAIFSWPLWLIFILGGLTMTFAWLALMVKIDIVVENILLRKITEIKK